MPEPLENRRWSGLKTRSAIQRRSVGAIVVAVALLIVTLSPVAATYPGTTNGKLAFAIKDADGNPQINVAEPDGARLQALTTGAFFHACAAYSADGSKIAYCSNETGAFEIWTMNADGTGQAQLTKLGGSATFPDFSPDGTLVAFDGTSGSRYARRDPHRRHRHRRDGHLAHQLRHRQARLRQRLSGLVTRRQPDRLHPHRRRGRRRQPHRRAGLADGRRRQQRPCAHHRRAAQGSAAGLEPGRFADRLRERTGRQRRHLGHERRRIGPAPAHRLHRDRPITLRDRRRLRCGMVSRRPADRVRPSPRRTPTGRSWS